MPRALLASLIAFVVAMVVAGITMFVIRGGGRDAESGMGPCTPGSTSPFSCIPHLKAEDLVAALKKRGFKCFEPGGSRGCKLEIGETEFHVGVEIAEGGISGLSASLWIRADEEPTEGGIALLRWVAGVPFAHDRESADEVDAWLVKQIAEQKTVQVTIAGYEYRLERKPGLTDRKSVGLSIQENWG
ncbi:hypothetical protein AB0M36_02755 [Actinoplanes sp. NPDC051346]|uniref:hypothetical protein n=1 Tax=Actinoplanes sp. NPDC051346 TaxID=3155048 RepID=UPI003438EA2F